MSDSNPRRDDWDNTLRGVYLFAVLVIIGVFLFVLFVTGHAVAAFWIIMALSAATLAIYALIAPDKD